jgi:hypothetical protein
MTPHEILASQKDLFDFVENTETCPDPSDGRVQAIWNAYKEINPQAHVDWTCGVCVMNMIKQANNTRKLHYYTFPKQD